MKVVWNILELLECRIIHHAHHNHNTNGEVHNTHERVDQHQRFLLIGRRCIDSSLTGEPQSKKQHHESFVRPDVSHRKEHRPSAPLNNSFTTVTFHLDNLCRAAPANFAFVVGFTPNLNLATVLQQIKVCWLVLAYASVVGCGETVFDNCLKDAVFGP